MAEFEKDFLSHISIDNGKHYFTTDEGVKIALRPISKVHLQRWNIEFEKAYPAPVPPVIQVEVGIGNKKEKMYEINANDPYYLQLVDSHASLRSYEMQIFLIRLGTTTPAPPEYATMFECQTEEERRLDYISSLLLSDHDVEYFLQAVLSQTELTHEALNTSAARFPSNGAGPERLSVSVLAETGQGNSSFD